MFEVVLTFRDSNMPKIRQKEKTEELALGTVRSWLKRFAGVKCVTLADEAAKERHVFTYAGYQFTVPVL
jgi:hypothetical protein